MRFSFASSLSIFFLGHFFLLTPGVYGQSIPSSPNELNDSGRQGQWTIYFDKNWEVTEDSSKAAFYRLINYENDKPVGPVLDYFRSGQLQMKAYLKQDRPQVMDGIAKYYTADGQLESVYFSRGDRSVEESIQEIEGDSEILKDRHTVLLMADLYHDIRSEKARPLYKKYLGMVKREMGENSLEYAEAQLKLAWDYLRHLDFINAEPLFFSAKRFIDKNRDQSVGMYVSIRNDIADYYSHIGRYDEALKYFIEAQELAKKYVPKDDYLHFVIIHNMASCYRSTGDYEKALELSEIAVDDARKRFGKYHRESANVLKALAYAYDGLGDREQSRNSMYEVLEIYDSIYGDTHNEYLSVLYDIGIMHVRSGDIEKGAEIYYKVYKKFDALYGAYHQSTIQVQRSYGFALYRSGKKDEAIKILRSAAQNRQKYLYRYFDQMNEKNRQILFTQYQAFNHFQSSLMMTEMMAYPELISDLLNMQLYNKAILLSTSNAIKKRILESNDRKLIELYNEVQSLRQTLGKISELSDDEAHRKYQLNQDSIAEVFEIKDRELNRLSSVYSTSSALPKWESIRDKLDKKEALVEIHSYREFDLKEWRWNDEIKYVAFVVSAKTKELPTVVNLYNGNYLEKEGISAYTNKVRFKLKDTDSYTHFWKPLETHLRKFDKIYLSADGVYHKINLQTLINPASGKYLMEEKDIQIVTSGRDLIEEKRMESPVKLGMLVGNPDFGELPEGISGTIRGIELLSTSHERSGLAPLPGAEQEVEAVAELLEKNGWKSIVLKNEEAEEAALKDMLRPNILHIATHGFFSQEDSDEDNPLKNTGLLLTGAAKSLATPEGLETSEDGILTSFEALNLNIDNTSLVVLSACETGLGDLKNGEGIYGLQRAFKIAGARTIIMSLWKVDDTATNKLMTLFYKNWLSNAMTKRQAFHTAQKQLMAEYDHPYYWGAFVVLGE